MNGRLLLLLFLWVMPGVLRTGPARLTLAQVRRLPATVDVATAAGALGISRAGLYEAIRAGRSPVKTLTVQRRVLVLTADLQRVLEGGSADAA